MIGRNVKAVIQKMSKAEVSLRAEAEIFVIVVMQIFPQIAEVQTSIQTSPSQRVCQLLSSSSSGK